MTTMAEMERAVNVNVGVLGHVDSGKTHLVRVLSTHLSTAALDKHPQSQQRGMTLDFGERSLCLRGYASAGTTEASESAVDATTQEREANGITPPLSPQT